MAFFLGFLAPRRLGGSSECVCLAREARGDQEDDGDGSQRHREAGRNCGDGGHRQTEGVKLLLYVTD